MSVRYRVTRSYLVRRVQTYEVDVPESVDVRDFGQFDQHVCDNGDLLTESHEVVDHDDLQHDGVFRLAPWVGPPVVEP